MFMGSSLIIGCKHCAETYRASQYEMPEQDKTADYQFPFTTAFTEETISQLQHFYICPYCEEALYLSPVLLKYIDDFFDRSYHIQLENGGISIISDSISLEILDEESPRLLAAIMGQLGWNISESPEKEFPTTQDISRIQRAAREVDRKKWLFRIESGKAESPYAGDTNGWYNDYL